MLPGMQRLLLLATLLATTPVHVATWEASFRKCDIGKSFAKVVWPKNNRFTCIGELVRDDNGLHLAQNQQSLVWCEIAEISDDNEAKVIKVCTVGDLCEIRGTIHGHGAFLWTKITKVRKLKE